MAEGPSIEQAVELVYRPAVKDFASALKARSRATPLGRRQRKIFIICTPVVAICFVMALLASGGRDLPVQFWFLAVALPVFFLGIPRLQARQFHRLAEKHGEFTTVVTVAGVSVTTKNASSRTNWEMLPRYVEVSDVFVLLSPDKHAVGMTVLPKRALMTVAETDRLRSLLDRYSSRANS